VFGWFGLIHWKYQLEHLSQGSTFEAISRDDLKNLLILIPTFLPEQRKIASILSKIDKTIEKEQQYKAKLQRIKRGLMEDLLIGKVRVNHLIEKVEKNVSQT